MSVYCLQPRLDRVAGAHLDDGFFQAPALTLAGVDHVHFPALQAGVLGVHPQQLGRPQRRLAPSRPGPHLKSHLTIENPAPYNVMQRERRNSITIVKWLNHVEWKNTWPLFSTSPSMIAGNCLSGCG